jgi:hypothetical protein
MSIVKSLLLALPLAAQAAPAVTRSPAATELHELIAYLGTLR